MARTYPPPGDGRIADCVANAPGGPVHVLVTNLEAEHIPGCNMAFRVDRLKAIEGFDRMYRAAGDDVDICWRLQEAGGKIGFNPAAVVWHHRRNSVKTYWKQQKGYGKAEALLESKWPERYNAVGHLSWEGRLYGRGLVQLLPVRQARIYHGIWGSAPFQSLYQPAPDLFSALPTMPEWYLLSLLPLGLSLVGFIWPPALATLPILALAIAVPLLQSAWSASHATFTTPQLSQFDRYKLYGLTTIMYLMQPLARLWGRFDNGLTPWRRRGFASFRWPAPCQMALWSETWRSPDQYLTSLHDSMVLNDAIAIHGVDYSDWDLHCRGGLAGSIRFLLAIEEHGAGKQLLRLKMWPQVSRILQWVAGLLVALAIVAGLDGSPAAAAVIGLVVLLLGTVAFLDCAKAMSSLSQALKQLQEGFDLTQ